MDGECTTRLNPASSRCSPALVMESPLEQIQETAEVGSVLLGLIDLIVVFAYGQLQICVHIYSIFVTFGLSIDGK